MSKLSRSDRRLALPAEWSRQSAVVLVWPHGHSDWAPLLPRVEETYAMLVMHISARQHAVVVCYDGAHRAHVQAKLTAQKMDLARVRFAIAPTNDTWVRDSGPLAVFDATGRPLLLDFRFNGWGGKYDASLDDGLTRTLDRQGIFGGTDRQEVDLILEGGSIDVDGQGTLLTTRACLLSPTRNTLNKAQLEQTLARLLGVERFLWLDHGFLRGDDTDSHVDMLARFADPDTICYTTCDDPDDEHYAALQAMAGQLAGFRRADGNGYTLVPLPIPKAKYDDDGERLPASYANFLIINNAVLVPTYDDPADTHALAQLARCFPDRQIIAVPSLALIEQRGSIHCASMQLPAGVL